jgi:hypothetical protein
VTLCAGRDLPVLRALVETQNHEVRSGYLFLGGGVAREKLGVDLEDADVGLALLTLRDAGISKSRTASRTAASPAPTPTSSSPGVACRLSASGRSSPK